LINDVEKDYVKTAVGILSELLKLANHSTFLYAHSINASALYGLIKPRRNDKRRRVIITSPPYGRADFGGNSFSRGYDKLVITNPGNMTLYRGTNLRAVCLNLLTSLCLRNHNRNNDLVIIVLKNLASSGLKTKTFLELTRELSDFVGFKVVEVLKFRLEANRFARYHDLKGNNHDLWHEYVITLRKKSR